MNTTTYPLTTYHYPTHRDDRDPCEFVGVIGGSDVDQIDHIVTTHMHNDPTHFHKAFPAWTRLTVAIRSNDNATACDADDEISYLQPDIEAWLAEYEGIEWEGGEPYRYH